MATYTIYVPARFIAGEREPSPEAADEVRFVKEGFSWPALFVPLLWLLYHRMWGTLALYLAVVIALGWTMAALSLSATMTTIVWLVFGILFALEANTLRRLSLERRGYRLSDIVSGSSLQECEQRFFTAWLNRAPPARPVGAGREPRPPIVPSAPPGGDVLGLFPERGRQ